MAQITKQKNEKRGLYHGYVVGQNNHTVVYKDSSGQGSIARKSVRAPLVPALPATKLPARMSETKPLGSITINIHSGGENTSTVRAVIVAGQVTIDICSSPRMLPQSNHCVAKIMAKPETSGSTKERLYKEVAGGQGMTNKTTQEPCLSEESRQGEQPRTVHFSPATFAQLSEDENSRRGCGKSHHCHCNELSTNCQASLESCDPIVIGTETCVCASHRASTSNSVYRRFPHPLYAVQGSHLFIPVPVPIMYLSHYGDRQGCLSECTPAINVAATRTTKGTIWPCQSRQEEIKERALPQQTSSRTPSNCPQEHFRDSAGASHEYQKFPMPRASCGCHVAIEGVPVNFQDRLQGCSKCHRKFANSEKGGQRSEGDNTPGVWDECRPKMSGMRTCGSRNGNAFKKNCIDTEDRSESSDGRSSRQWDHDYGYQEDFYTCGRKLRNDHTNASGRGSPLPHWNGLTDNQSSSDPPPIWDPSHGRCAPQTVNW